MIEGIQNIIASPTFYNITESTAAQMSIKTSLNSIGRPGFILMDKKIDPHTKRFSATKEFLYQLLSLSLYMAIIIPVFKNGGFKLAQKLFKDEAVFKAFKNPEKFSKFHKLTEEEKLAKLEELSNLSKTGDKFTRQNINQESEYFANGVIETSSLIGTVTGLAIVAPLTAAKLIHPIMKFVGLNKKQTAESDNNNNNNNNNNDNEKLTNK